MAHHQGMSLVALANACSTPRWCSAPCRSRVQATALLLQERVRAIHRSRGLAARRRGWRHRPPPWRCAVPVAHTRYPHAQFLSNGAYTASSPTRGRGEFLPRQGRHPVPRGLDPHPGSQFLYLRDVRSGSVWSAAYHPTDVEPEEYLSHSMQSAPCSAAVTYIATQLDIAVSNEDDVEVRPSP